MQGKSEGVRIAVAGAGLVGRQHIRLIMDSADCVLSAVVDPAPEAGMLGRDLGVPVFTDIDALLGGDDRPDGMILATPTPLHPAQCIACAEAGVAVLVEKPLAATYAEGIALCRAIEDCQAPVLVGHHRVHSPIMARARDLIAEGAIGTVVGLNGNAMFHKPDSYFAAAPWRSQPGGGPILINLIHDIGNLRMLGGEIIAVQAFCSNTARHGAVEDTAAIILRFASGALGTFLLSDAAATPWSWEQTSRENPAFATYDQEDCYVVAGTDGSLAIPTMRMWRYSGDAEKSWWRPFETITADIARDDPLKCQLAHFRDVITGDAAPLVTARDGLQNLRIAEAIAESAAAGKVVETDG